MQITLEVYARQAIGVREFEDFLKTYISEGQRGMEDGISEEICDQVSAFTNVEKLIENMNAILRTSGENPLKQLLQDAINKVKLNTRRLVHRQKRRLIRLQTLFGWNIHYVDATQCLSCLSEEPWTANVVEPSIQIIKFYFDKDTSVVPDSDTANGTKGLKLMERDLWTQHICNVPRHVGIRCLEGRTSGNNIKKVGVIAKEFAGLGSPDWSLWLG